MTSTSNPTIPTAWRYSLGDLFRGLTICGLILLAAVQLGPLAAARDLGFGLAIGLVVWGWSSRSRMLLLLAGMAAVTGIVPTILAAGAPYTIRDAVCLECGQMRQTRNVCGWKIHDQISESDYSRWATPLVRAGHTHSWAIGSSEIRSQWFGRSTIACGGPQEGAPIAYQLARLKDNAAGVEAYQEYLDIVSGKSAKSLAVHRQELWDALNAAAAAKR